MTQKILQEYKKTLQQYKNHKYIPAFKENYEANKEKLKTTLKHTFPQSRGILIDQELIHINYYPFTKVTQETINIAKQISTNAKAHLTRSGTVIEIQITEGDEN